MSRLATRSAARVVEGPQDWWRVGVRPRPGFGTGADSRAGDWVGRTPPLEDTPAADLAEHIPHIGPIIRGGRQLSGTQSPRQTYNRLQRMTDAELVRVFKHWFWALGTGDLGVLMIDYFASGKGGTLHHPANSELSNDLVRVDTVRTFLDAVKAAAHTQLRQQHQRGRVDAKALALPAGLVLATRLGDRTYTPKLRALLGGIQGVEVSVRRLQETGPAERPDGYRLDLMVRVYDDFGVGEDDLYQEGLIAMWTLQHQRTARPYVNMVDVQFNIAGKW